MKIAFDIRPFLKNETGVGIYYKNLLKSLASIDNRNTYKLLSSSFKERFPKEHLPSFQNLHFRDLKIPVKILNYLWYKLGTPPIDLFLGRTDLTHSPSPVIIPSTGKSIITVHDLCFIETPELAMDEAVRDFSEKIEKSLKKADGIIAVSHSTADTILKNYGDHLKRKMKVVYHGTDMPDINPAPLKIKLPDEFILSVGTIEPRKDFSTLIKGFARIHKEFSNLHLVIAGAKGWKQSHLPDLIKKNGLEQKVIFTGYVTRNNLKYLYSKAKLQVFPSLYEGFGLPLLESAACGLPSIASDLKVFKEVFGDYPIYFRKSDEKDLAKKLKDTISETVKLEDSIQKGLILSRNFSWEKTARSTLEFYEEVTG